MKRLSRKLAQELEYLKNLKDEDIDFSDISEMKMPKELFVGKFYRPAKKSLGRLKRTSRQPKS